MTEVVFPDQTNHLGTLFGGHALRMMDMAAGVAANRHARRTVVTVAVEDVQFAHPVHHGELAELTARVESVGRTSVGVRVDLVSEDLATGARKVCAHGRFVLVAVDDEGTPIEVPPLEGPRHG
jgi:acyl-CoA hydrolase